MCVGLVYIILKACPLHKAGRWMPSDQGDIPPRLARGGRGLNKKYALTRKSKFPFFCCVTCDVVVRSDPKNRQQNKAFQKKNCTVHRSEGIDK